MGRKKKKKSSIEGGDDRTSVESSSSSSLVVDSNTNTTKDQQQRVVVEELLTVRLSPTNGLVASSRSSSSSNQKSPNVLLALEDARRLDVVPGDEVILLLARAEDDDTTNNASSTKIVGAAVYKVAPFPSSSSSSSTAATVVSYHHSPSSTRTPTTTPRKRNKPLLTAGTIQLTSSTAVDALLSSSTLSGDNSEEREEQEKVKQSQQSDSKNDVPIIRTVSPISQSPTIQQQTPSSSSTPFSFKDKMSRRDQYNTPPPRTSFSPSRTPTSNSKARHTSTPTSSSQSQQQQPITIVSTSSSLGRWIGKRICSKAEKVILQIVNGSENLNNNMKRSIENNNIILKRIVLAYVVDRFVQFGEVLQCSFQGKPIELRVERVIKAAACDATTSTTSTGGGGNKEPTLESALSNLTINNSEEIIIDDNVERIKEAVLDCSTTIQLFLITYSTSIEFSSNNNKTPEEEEEMLDAKPIAEEQVQLKQRQQRKQYVAGLSSTLEQVRSLLITPLSQPDIFARGSMKAPKGILLHGPSGVGKSCLAKQLVLELESSCSCDVTYVNCTSLQSQTAIVGEAERQLSRLFWPPNDNSRTKLLVLDDVHLICPKRGGYNNPGTDRLAATLLSLIDGVDTSRGDKVLILAITNNPSLLDPALRRPGRIDAEVEVPIPDEASTRAEILQYQVSSLGAQLTNATNENWLELGKLAKGFNGADCMLAVKEALRKSILKDDQQLNFEHEQLIDLSIDDVKAAIRETKPSAIKSVTVEIPQVRWTSIGGMESVKKELREAVELPLTHDDLFRQLRIPPPRGILLYGPPGCSKTLMARALATEGQMNFLAVKGPELLSKWLGESERALASLFRRARMASPCIIFFDEVDAIAMKRGSGDSASSSRLLSQLLTELDGVNNTGVAATGNKNNKAQRVVVIGATNRPDLLDCALMRPGRIDKMIYVGVPDSDSRAQIFRISLQDRACGEIDIAHLAKDEISQGFSGAEIVALCRDAALLALEEADNFHADTTHIEMRHLLSAIKDMKRQITPDMLDFYDSFRESTTTR